MSIEEDIREASGKLDAVSSRLESLEYCLEVLAGAMKQAGVIKEHHIREAKQIIKDENEQLERIRESKYRMMSIAGSGFGDFLRNF